MGQHGQDRSRHLVGQCDDHDILWPPLLHLLDPLTRLLCVLEDATRTVDQQRAQIRVPLLADRVQIHLAARTRLPRYNPNPCGEFPP